MDHGFDEMHSAPDLVREHYRSYARWLAEQPAEVMRSRREEAEMIFRRVGITFAVYGAKDDDGGPRHRAADSVRPDSADHPGRRVARDGARAGAARHRAQPLPARRLPRPGNPRGRHRADGAGPRERAVPSRDDGRARARQRLLAYRRHRHRARRRPRWQRHLLRARRQPARAQRRELHAGEPQDDDAAVPRAVQPAPRRAGGALPRPAARDAALAGSRPASTSRPWWC